MNKANLKSYAPKARLDFIKAVTERANVLGISAAGVVPAEVRGDVALIDGREWPNKVAGQRNALIARIKRHGFEQTMDEVAYTWFNRFAALRYMEIHDYLGHGWRVLSSRDGGLPEILRHASEVTLPGLNADRAREMQLAGNQDNELYKLLLVAQCNELSRVMPFLFERIDDETELLLPENLLRTDSIVAKLVEQVPEEDWQEIEVIGWLYQFYISEKKDQVIGKVVKSEDIPAATQLFTPNWIVQYLVQNSVGRLWLMANPTSTLASQWPYYIQPAEQKPEVQAQLNALIQTRICEDGEALNPETLTMLDPACGSGHILVVAYDVLKAIYLERGYQPRAIPRLILEKNLYGLDIDDRAGQLAAFALLMKARADDRRLFNDPPKLNVMSLQDSTGLDIDELARSLAGFRLQRTSLKALVETFESAKTFGSLIRVPAPLNEQLATMTAGLQLALQNGDLYAMQAAQDVLPLVWQALILGMRFDAVVANPPYMGGKGMHPGFKTFALANYERGKSDLFAMFIERGIDLCRNTGACSLVTMQSWMFLSSYEALRDWILNTASVDSLLQIGYNSFPELNSKVAQACAFVLMRGPTEKSGIYLNLNDAPQSADKQAVFLERLAKRQLTTSDSQSFKIIPGSPIAYWVSENVRAAFSTSERLGSVAKPRQGLASGDNDRFMRYWHEVNFSRIGFGFEDHLQAKESGMKWFPHNKGGGYRKWFGNMEYVLAFDRENYDALAGMGNHLPSRQLYFKEGMSWTALTSGNFNGRYTANAIFDAKGPVLFSDFPEKLPYLIAYCNSSVATAFLKILAPTLDFNQGPVGNLPIRFPDQHDLERVSKNASSCIEIARADWNMSETSWDFSGGWLKSAGATRLMCHAWQKHQLECAERRKSIQAREVENNQILVDLYGLNGEVSTDVGDAQITLATADRERDCQSLTSYVIGCIMGRYSLDESGLIYAHSGNVGFDPSRYKRSFPADADGIVPLTIECWFDDDAASRVREFLRVIWGAETLGENMAWLAESLGTKGSETPDETIRRYLADKFYKDHLQTYKKRPIYWLFSSGKQGAFQALVYLHRYNEGTLARMRAEYVVPLIAKMASRLDMLDKDVAAASSAAARTKLQKQIEALRKKQIELLAYDEKLRHYADMRITLDLDDGVKVNYAKFGDLVAESEAITGGSDE